MKSAIFAAAVFLTACSASSNETTSIASTSAVLHHINRPIFGCIHLETAHRISQIDGEGDQAAALDYIRQNIASGECNELNKGDPVYLEEARRDGLDHIRPQGSTVSLWTIREVVGE